MRKYYDYLWIHQKLHGAHDRTPLYKDMSLSSTLRKDIALHVAKNYFPIREALTGVGGDSLLEGCPDDCLMDMILAMTIHVFLPKTVIIKDGDIVSLE